jgi:hypothetical protein
MSGCRIDREVAGSIARYRVCGRFEAACAWELARRIESDPLGDLALDFSQCGDFVDYGVAVLANALLAAPRKRVRLEGLRQHQERLFKYFGVNIDPGATPDHLSPPAPGEADRASKVA